MARKVSFGDKPRSKADRANPFFEFMSPAERKWAAGNIRKGGSGGGKRKGGKGGGS